MVGWMFRKSMALLLFCNAMLALWFAANTWLSMRSAMLSSGWAKLLFLKIMFSKTYSNVLLVTNKEAFQSKANHLLANRCMGYTVNKF